MFDLKNTKYHVQYTSRFKKEYKKVIKQGKNKEKFLEVLNKIANGEELETKYRNHKLINNNNLFIAQPFYSLIMYNFCTTFFCPFKVSRISGDFEYGIP